LLQAGKPLKTWKPAVKEHTELKKLADDVEAYARKFPMPGRDEY